MWFWKSVTENSLDLGDSNKLRRLDGGSNHSVVEKWYFVTVRFGRSSPMLRSIEHDGPNCRLYYKEFVLETETSFWTKYGYWPYAAFAFACMCVMWGFHMSARSIVTLRYLRILKENRTFPPDEDWLGFCRFIYIFQVVQYS